MDDRDTYDHLQIILPDILPIVARHINTGAVFKAFREVSRLFKKVIEEAHPEGDIVFADHYRTIIARYHMVLNREEYIYFNLPNIIPDMTRSEFMDLTEQLFNIYFDELVTNIMPFLENVNNNDYPDDSDAIRQIAEEMVKRDNDSVLNDNNLTQLHVDMIRRVKAGIWIINVNAFNDFKDLESSKLFVAIMNNMNIRIEVREYMCSLDVIENNPTYDWDYSAISSNPHLTKEFYLAHRNEVWSTEAVIRNPTLTFEEAKQIAELSDWGYTSCCLLSRVDVPWDFLLDNIRRLSEISPRIILYTKPNCANTVTKWRQVVATLYDSAMVIYHDSYMERVFTGTSIK